MDEPLSETQQDSEPRHEVRLGRFVPPDPVQLVIPEEFPASHCLLWIPRSRSEGDPDRMPDADIMVTQKVLTQVAEHLARGLAHEHAGFLLGNRYSSPTTRREYVVIDNCTRAQQTHNTPVSVTFTPETWVRFKEDLDLQFRGKMAVGWYHSHPKLGIFLSPDDVGLHNTWFTHASQCALVVDPDGSLGGFFALSNGELSASHPCTFYELLSRDETESRRTAAGWKNYFCRDPLTQKPISPVPLPRQEQRERNIPPPPMSPRRSGTSPMMWVSALVALGVGGYGVYAWSHRAPAPIPAVQVVTTAPQVAASPARRDPIVIGGLSRENGAPRGQTARSGFYWFKVVIASPTPWNGKLRVVDWTGQARETIQDANQPDTFHFALPAGLIGVLHANSGTAKTIRFEDAGGTYTALAYSVPDRDLANPALAVIATGGPSPQTTREVDKKSDNDITFVEQPADTVKQQEEALRHQAEIAKQQQDTARQQAEIAKQQQDTAKQQQDTAKLQRDTAKQLQDAPKTPQEAVKPLVAPVKPPPEQVPTPASVAPPKPPETLQLISQAFDLCASPTYALCLAEHDTALRGILGPIILAPTSDRKEQDKARNVLVKLNESKNSPYDQGKAKAVKRAIDDILKKK